MQTHRPPYRRETVNADGMPRWVPRAVRLVIIVIVGLFVGYNLVKALRGFLVLLTISVFMAVALEPAVSYLARRGWRRGLATAFLFVMVALFGGLFLALMVPVIVNQVVLLAERAPDYVAQLSDSLALLGVDFDGDSVSDALSSIEFTPSVILGGIAGNALRVGSTVIGTIFQGLTVLLFTFYLTAEAPKFRRILLSTLQPSRQEEVLRMVEIAIDKTGGYFYSRALLAGIAAVATWIALTVLGIPYAAPLAIWVGVLSQFVPVVGTYIGGLLPVLIALLEDPRKAIGVVLFIAAYQQFENYAIGPRITARTMSLHPAIAFGAAIVGGTLMGAPGTLMALPVAATLQAFISTYAQRHQLVASELFDDVPAISRPQEGEVEPADDVPEEEGG